MFPHVQIGRVGDYLISAAIVMVTPQIAAEWLNKMGKNRPLSSYVVKMYTKDMLAGGWSFITQPITFAASGRLIDGQHRLQAIIESGVTMPFLVVCGVPESAISFYDQQKKRSAFDALIAGWGMETTNNVTAAAKAMISLASSGISVSQLHSFMVEHEACMAFLRSLIEEVSSAKVSVSAIWAVCGRAYYHMHTSIILRFYHILCDGICIGEEESAAVRLRNRAIEFSGRGMPRRILYRLAETALFNFEKKRPLKVLRESEGELFLLPEEIK